MKEEERCPFLEPQPNTFHVYYTCKYCANAPLQRYEAIKYLKPVFDCPFRDGSCE
jgi:hypothetical protein